MTVLRHLRGAVPVVGVLLCGLLASCGSGGASSATPTAAAQAATAGPGPGATPSIKAAPPSRLCTILDLTTARKVLASLVYSPQVAPDHGSAPDECSYATSDGGSLLVLAPTSRPYATELSMAHSLLRDPAASGMSNVTVRELSGPGQGAFLESAYALQQQQTITWLVWRSGSHSWVLSLAQVSATESPDRLVRVARMITAALPH